MQQTRSSLNRVTRAWGHRSRRVDHEGATDGTVEPTRCAPRSELKGGETKLISSTCTHTSPTLQNFSSVTPVLSSDIIDGCGLAEHVGHVSMGCSTREHSVHGSQFPTTTGAVHEHCCSKGFSPQPSTREIGPLRGHICECAI